MKTFRSLIPLALLSLFFLTIGCGTSDDGDGNGGNEGNGNADRGSTERDTGGGTDDAATADTGSGGGACGAATPCSANSDCAEDEYCNVGCCAERTGGTEDTGGGSGVPCGELTYEGECDGETVRWCQDGNAEEADCTAMFPAEAATGTCEYISAEFGYWCAVQPEDTCVFSSGDQVIVAFCTGTEPGCILSGAAQACRENIGACTEADEGACDDNGILIVGCSEGQPVGFDCVIDGGSCSTDRCIDQGVGGVCGTVGSVEFTCAADLTCSPDTGLCEGGE